MTEPLPPARLAPRDLVRVSASGLRARPLRVLLSALGIAIGIGAMVAVVGISSSSQAQLNAELSRLGTNLLTVSAGKTLVGEDAKLPVESVRMVARIGPVTSASGTGTVTDTRVYRNDHIPADRSGGIVVLDTESGKEITVLPITTGVDDLVFDSARKRLYASCDGNVDVYAQSAADSYKPLGKVSTGALARTALLVPQLNRYFVAVPQHGTTSAEIQVFEIH